MGERGLERQASREDGGPERDVIRATVALDHLARHLVMAGRDTLTKSQLDVMMGLAVIGSMSMTQMSRHLAASKEQATRAVAPLVDEGLVARERQSANRRVVEISLTDKGRACLAEHDAQARTALKARLDEFAEKDRERLVAACHEIVDILQAQGEREGLLGSHKQEEPLDQGGNKTASPASM
ncbi:MAG: MarR family transcriptional regulator [Coriobacteriia bacterium]|nr:MarR family transcriptional regulator [Coriobacteriia bacterium]MBS5478215.1 MarR family transcriptional regulator [Coriobacteriia bacterium]